MNSVSKSLMERLQQRTAKIAVLGPMRMNYGRVISAVFHVGQSFRTVA